MSRLVLLAIAALLLSGVAGAQSSASRLAKAHAALKGGAPAEALELLRELQVEEPNDERIRYALGCAQYKLAEAQASVQDAAGGAAAPAVSFADAQQTFEALSSATDPVIARAAAFNRANCIAQAAKAQLANPEVKQEALAGLRSAVGAYEDLLRRYPGDSGAQQNLDHTRLLLKKLLAEEDEQSKEEEKKKPEEQPKATLSVRNAATEIPGARAMIGEDNTVQLVEPGTTGGQP